MGEDVREEGRGGGERGEGRGGERREEEGRGGEGRCERKPSRRVRKGKSEVQNMFTYVCMTGCDKR